MNRNLPYSRGWRVERYAYKSGNIGFMLTSPPVAGLYDKPERGRRYAQTFDGKVGADVIRKIMRDLAAARRYFVTVGRTHRLCVNADFAKRFPQWFGKPAKLLEGTFQL